MKLVIEGCVKKWLPSAFAQMKKNAAVNIFVGKVRDYEVGANQRKLGEQNNHLQWLSRAAVLKFLTREAHNVTALPNMSW